MLQFKPVSKVNKVDMEAIRLDHIAFIESIRGANGKDGLDGTDGKDGEQGIQGFRGSQGATGRDGARGPAGPQGEKGEKGDSIKGDKGDTGADGRGIDRMYIRRGDLYVVYTDGEEVNLGRVEGQQGIQGPRGRSGSVIDISSALLSIVDTAITEEIGISNNMLIRQTSYPITTSLTTPSRGNYLTIKNASIGDNVLNLTLDGCVNPTINAGESFKIVYNGSDWNLL
jgi:hypothetical protein